MESCATSCLKDKSQPNIYFQWHRRFLRSQGKPEQHSVHKLVISMILSALHVEIDNVACGPYKLTESQMPSLEPFTSENKIELQSC